MFDYRMDDRRQGRQQEGRLLDCTGRRCLQDTTATPDGRVFRNFLETAPYRYSDDV